MPNDLITALLQSGRVPPAASHVTPEERAFQQWYRQWATKNKMDPNPDSPEQQYDYRKAFKQKVPPPNVLAGEHWPSQEKDPGHPNLVVGGFNTKTGKPEPGAPLELNVRKLIDMGWAPETAHQLVKQASGLDQEDLERKALLNQMRREK